MIQQPELRAAHPWMGKVHRWEIVGTRQVRGHEFFLALDGSVLWRGEAVCRLSFGERPILRDLGPVEEGSGRDERKFKQQQDSLRDALVKYGPSKCRIVMDTNNQFFRHGSTTFEGLELVYSHALGIGEFTFYVQGYDLEKQLAATRRAALAEHTKLRERVEELEETREAHVEKRLGLIGELAKQDEELSKLHWSLRFADISDKSDSTDSTCDKISEAGRLLKNSKWLTICATMRDVGILPPTEPAAPYLVHRHPVTGDWWKWGYGSPAQNVAREGDFVLLETGMIGVTCIEKRELVGRELMMRDLGPLADATQGKSASDERIEVACQELREAVTAVSLRVAELEDDLRTVTDQREVFKAHIDKTRAQLDPDHPERDLAWWRGQATQYREQNRTLRAEIGRLKMIRPEDQRAQDIIRRGADAIKARVAELEKHLRGSGEAYNDQLQRAKDAESRLREHDKADTEASRRREVHIAELEAQLTAATDRIKDLEGQRKGTDGLVAALYGLRLLSGNPTWDEAVEQIRNRTADLAAEKADNANMREAHRQVVAQLADAKERSKIKGDEFGRALAEANSQWRTLVGDLEFQLGDARAKRSEYKRQLAAATRPGVVTLPIWGYPEKTGTFKVEAMKMGGVDSGGWFLHASFGDASIVAVNAKHSIFAKGSVAILRRLDEPENKPEEFDHSCPGCNCKMSLGEIESGGCDACGASWATDPTDEPEKPDPAFPPSPDLGQTFQPWQCPFTFKGQSCGYVGPMTACDKTAIGCRAHGNFERFGGRPRMASDPTIKEYPCPDCGRQMDPEEDQIGKCAECGTKERLARLDEKTLPNATHIRRTRIKDGTRYAIWDREARESRFPYVAGSMDDDPETGETLVWIEKPKPGFPPSPHLGQTFKCASNPQPRVTAERSPDR